MINVRIEGETRRIGEPEDWDAGRHGKCSTISVRDITIDGIKWMQSGYEPTPSDLVRLQTGGRLVLGIAGRGDPPIHPVVQLFTSTPPTDADARNLRCYVIREEVDRDGRKWCRVSAQFGEMTFPAGFEITSGEVAFFEAASRLIGAIEGHAKSVGWK